MIKINQYAGLNLKKLKFLGSGNQGKVYQIDSNKCIKIFKRSFECKDEYDSLVVAQGDPHFPILYEYGDSYIIREYVNGTQLDKYLKKNPLTQNMSNKIIVLYEAMYRVGYNRLDTALFHIFVTESGELKLIDTSKAFKLNAIFPDIIVRGLAKLGYKEEFLSFVKGTRPKLYKTWTQYSDKL